MESLPTGRDVVLNVATPVALSVPVPKGVVPFRKDTLPVAAAVPDCGVIFAVKVTL
jgi:hypothetical protein